MKNMCRGSAAHQISETEAIAGAKRGDPESFEILYRRHKGHVYSLCLRMIKNRHRRRTDSGGVSSGLPKDSQFPRRIRLFDMGIPRDIQYRAYASAQKTTLRVAT